MARPIHARTEQELSALGEMTSKDMFDTLQWLVRHIEKQMSAMEQEKIRLTAEREKTIGEIQDLDEVRISVARMLDFVRRMPVREVGPPDS